MLDKPLAIMLRNGLMASFAARGLTGFQCKQNFQPTQQGRPAGPTIYFYKTFDRRYGFRKIVQDRSFSGALVMPRIEKQKMEATISFAVTMPPGSDLTHEDAMKIAAGIVQSPDFIAYLLTFDAAVLRVTDIRNVPYVNDQGNFEANPTFDAIITHTDTFVDGVPEVDVIEFDSYPI